MGRLTLALVLLLVLATPCLISPACGDSATPCRQDLRIIDKTKLTAERLAEAMAAKALLKDDMKLLRAAAETSPSDARYWYLLARKTMPDAAWIESLGCNRRLEAAEARGRLLLERSLRADSGYLPALYAYATTKPSHEQGMQALKILAEIDADNAEPCYLMAMERFWHIVKGRRITDESDREAYAMSLREWQSVSDLIEQGNDRPMFVWRACQLPSTRDVQLSIRGKVCPAAAMRCYAQLNMRLLNRSGDSRLDPHGECTGAYWRQLSRQAKWAAKTAAKSGDNAAAQHYLAVAMDLGYRYAACQPEQMLPLLVGAAIWMIAEEPAIELHKQSGDLAAAEELEAEDKAWKNACRQCLPLLKKTNVTVKQVKISRTGYLTYTDSAIEEAGMREILAGLATRDK